MLPRYEGTDQTPPQEDRLRLFRGTAFVAIRLPDLIRSAVQTGPGIDLEIYDVGAVGTVPSRLRAGDEAFDLRGGAQAPGGSGDHGRILNTEIAGRQWRIFYRTDEHLVGGGERAMRG
jgi:hypothetical protein